MISRIVALFGVYIFHYFDGRYLTIVPGASLGLRWGLLLRVLRERVESFALLALGWLPVAGSLGIGSTRVVK